MIRVLVTACTSGPLLEAQGAALRRQMACPYELTVVNDAKRDEHFSNMWERGKEQEIHDAAMRLGVKGYMRFPPAWHTDRRQVFPNEPDEFCEVENANTRCADAVQFGVNHLLAESDEPLLILDADMIPYRELEPLPMLEQYPVWGVPQTRGRFRYLWNGLILIDPKRAGAMDLFNLDCAHIDGTPVDVGGMLYPFVEANQGQIGVFRIASAIVLAATTNGQLPEHLRSFFRWDRDTQLNYRISETYGDLFAHLGGGGNWEVREKDEAEERVRRFIEAVS